MHTYKGRSVSLKLCKESFDWIYQYDALHSIQVRSILVGRMVPCDNNTHRLCIVTAIYVYPLLPTVETLLLPNASSV